MTMSLIFWILMLLWLLFGIGERWGMIAGPYGPWGHSIFLFVLFLLVGWQVFGAPIK